MDDSVLTSAFVQPLTIGKRVPRYPFLRTTKKWNRERLGGRDFTAMHVIEKKVTYVVEGNLAIRGHLNPDDLHGGRIESLL